MASSRPARVRPSTRACSLCLVALASSYSCNYSLGFVVVVGFTVVVHRAELLQLQLDPRGWSLAHPRLRVRGLDSRRAFRYSFSKLRANREDDFDDKLSPQSKSGLDVRGLLSDADFRRSDAVDATIRSLRRQLPRLLTVPISFESGSAEAYTVDTSIVIGDNSDDHNETRQVCSSRKELVDVSHAMVTFVTAVSRTSRFLESVLGGGDAFSAENMKGSASLPSIPFLDCKIVIDPNTTLDELRVDWTARWNAPSLPPGEGAMSEESSGKNEASPTSVVLKGSSKLLLSHEGKVRRHLIRRVAINGRTLDAAAIGGFLSDLRGNVQNFQRSPIYGFLASAALGASSSSSSSGGGGGSDEDGETDTPGATTPPANPFAPLLNMIRDEVFQQVSTAFAGPTERVGATSSSSDEPELAPVYVISSLLDDPSTNPSSQHNFLDVDRGVVLLLDCVENPNFARRSPSGSYPLPGTIAWSRYAKVHRLVVGFVNETIPVLADRPAHGVSDGRNPLPTLETLFATDCRYCLRSASGTFVDDTKVNGTASTSYPTSVTLLRTPRKVARLYSVMASWRRRFSGSDWSIDGVEILDWRSGPLTCVRIRYRSRLIVPSPPGISLSATTDTEVKVTGADVYSVNDQGRIVQVLQEELRVNDGSLRDGQLFTKNLCSAIEAGSGLGDDWWSAGIARLVFGDETTGPASAGRLGSGGIVPVAPDSHGFPDEAALTAFRVMEALVREVPLSLPSKASLRPLASSTPPAAQYMSDDVRLLGYLNETLIRGRSSYETSWNLAVASYATALRTNRIEAASTKPVTARVEWTSNRSIRLTAEVRLVVKPVHGLPIAPPLPASEAMTIPLRLQVVSDYVLDSTTGRIVAHRLVETRLNDQLAPGDVVARWIQQLTMTGSLGQAGTDTGVGDSAGKSPVGFPESSLLQWLRRSGSPELM